MLWTGVLIFYSVFFGFFAVVAAIGSVVDPEGRWWVIPCAVFLLAAVTIIVILGLIAPTK